MMENWVNALKVSQWAPAAIEIEANDCEFLFRLPGAGYFHGRVDLHPPPPLLLAGLL